MNDRRKTPFFAFHDKHVACVPKSGSSAIGRAIHFALRPNYVVRSASGNADMVDRVMRNPGWQAMAPKTDAPVNPAIPVRDPVERFRSACAQEGKTAQEAFDAIDAGTISGHFQPVTAWLQVDSKLFQFPEHIEELAAFLGLDEIPPVNESQTNNGPKPDLTANELERVQEIYAADIAIFKSIHAPGQELIIPAPEPEPEPLAPLKDRLKAIVQSTPTEAKAAFAPMFAGVEWLLDNGEIEAAQAAVAGVEVPNGLEAVKAALLTEF